MAATRHYKPEGWYWITKAEHTITLKPTQGPTPHDCDICRLSFKALISIHEEGEDWTNDATVCGGCLQKYIGVF